MMLILLMSAAIVVAQESTTTDNDRVIDLQELLQRVDESYRDFGQDIRDLSSDITDNVKLVVENANAYAQRSEANDKIIIKSLNDNALQSAANADANVDRLNDNADANAQLAVGIANNNAKMIIWNVNRVEDSIMKVIVNADINAKQVIDRLQENTDVLKQILSALSTNTPNINDFGGNPAVNETKVCNSTATQSTCPRPMTVQGKDCAEIYKKGVRTSGPQLITLSGTDESFMVYCDMETEGGGWTVFQRRGSYGLPTDYFNKNWTDYKNGFGNVEKEFWLGNDHLSALTKQTENVLRVDLRDLEWNRVYAKYSHFEVDDEQQLYRLSISGYSGSAGDSMATTTASGIGDMNNMAFTTRDRDNDKGDDCVTWMGGGGWWYNDCTWANLNGPNLQGTTSTHQSIFWQHWKNNWYSVGLAEMKIRPVDF